MSKARRRCKEEGAGGGTGEEIVARKALSDGGRAIEMMVMMAGRVR